MSYAEHSAVELAARLNDVASVWNWLPTFRAVAETEHVARAAEILHVSPPAVSRTIKLLEDHLGTKLFDDDLMSVVDHLNDTYYGFEK